MVGVFGHLPYPLRRSGARRVVPFALLACLVVLAAAWLRLGPDPSAVAQEATSPSTASPGPSSPSAASPDATSPSAASPSGASPSPGLDDLGSFLDDASASPFAEEEEEPAGIPGLGAVELVSGLDGLFPPEGFGCEGPVAGDETYTWVCADPSGTYGVEVIGDDPLAVLSVTATTRGVPDEDAERFFAHVLGLSVGDAADALDPEAWVAGAVPSGGTTFAGDVGVEVYGSREARALQVAASGL